IMNSWRGKVLPSRSHGHNLRRCYAATLLGVFVERTSGATADTPMALPNLRRRGVRAALQHSLHGTKRSRNSAYRVARTRPVILLGGGPICAGGVGDP